MSLIDGDEHGMPMLTGRRNQRADEGGHALHLGLPIEMGQVEQHRQAMFPGPGGRQSERGRVEPIAIQDRKVEMLGQRDELSLGVDDDLLDKTVGLLEDSSQCPAFACA